MKTFGTVKIKGAAKIIALRRVANAHKKGLKLKLTKKVKP